MKGVAHVDKAFLYETSPIQPLVQTVLLADRKNLYIGIPHKLNRWAATDPVLKAAMQRVQGFYRQTFWANALAYKCCLAALALAKRGLNVDVVYFFLGAGGVGLSLMTAHLAEMLGSNLHKYFDPQVFYLDEEMRKQIEMLVGAIVLTAQETRRLEEDVPRGSLQEARDRGWDIRAAAVFDTHQDDLSCRVEAHGA